MWYKTRRVRTLHFWRCPFYLEAVACKTNPFVLHIWKAGLLSLAANVSYVNHLCIRNSKNITRIIWPNKLVQYPTTSHLVFWFLDLTRRILARAAQPASSIHKQQTRIAYQQWPKFEINDIKRQPNLSEQHETKTLTSAGNKRQWHLPAELNVRQLLHSLFSPYMGFSALVNGVQLARICKRTCGWYSVKCKIFLELAFMADAFPIDMHSSAAKPS